MPAETGHVAVGSRPVVLGTEEVIAAASSFSRLRHFALLFWNHTYY